MGRVGIRETECQPVAEVQRPDESSRIIPSRQGESLRARAKTPQAEIQKRPGSAAALADYGTIGPEPGTHLPALIHPSPLLNILLLAARILSKLGLLSCLFQVSCVANVVQLGRTFLHLLSELDLPASALLDPWRVDPLLNSSWSHFGEDEGRVDGES
jgi:hypothetical protein